MQKQMPNRHENFPSMAQLKTGKAGFETGSFGCKKKKKHLFLCHLTLPHDSPKNSLEACLPLSIYFKSKTKAPSVSTVSKT